MRQKEKGEKGRKGKATGIFLPAGLAAEAGTV